MTSTDYFPSRADSALQAQLDEELRELELKRSKLKRQRNEESYINRLPTELIIRIFRQLRDDLFLATDKRPRDSLPKSKTKLGPHDWVVINAVSYGWRDIAINAHELWTHVDRSKCKDEFVGLILQRSATSPLHIRMDQDNGDPSWAGSLGFPNTDALFRNDLKRVESLRLNLAYFSSPEKFLQGPAPMLQAAEFYADPGAGTTLPWANLFRGCAPKLRMLSYSELLPDFTPLKPFGSITTLEIALHRWGRVHMLGTYLPNLESLQLDLQSIEGRLPPVQHFLDLQEIRLIGNTKQCHSALSRFVFGPTTAYFLHLRQPERANHTEFQEGIIGILRKHVAENRVIRCMRLGMSTRPYAHKESKALQSIALWDTPEPRGRPILQIVLEPLDETGTWAGAFTDEFLGEFLTLFQDLDACEISLAKCKTPVQFIFDDILAPCPRLAQMTLSDEWSLLCLTRTLERSPPGPGAEGASPLNFPSLNAVILPTVLNGHCHRLGKELDRFRAALSQRRTKQGAARLKLCKIYHGGRRAKKYRDKEPGAAIRITPQILGELRQEIEVVDCVLHKSLIPIGMSESDSS